jgi:EAL domain-containing protein (putative c-di-GMP-specific phosphodiesterase class I)/GGDEF domain-containing protein
VGLLAESEKRQWKQVVEALEETLVAEKKRSERLNLQLTTNAETGLPNSVVLHRELEAVLEGSPNPKAVLFMALNDSFGMLKRTFSTKIPEWILYQTSLRIQKVLGERGRIYHTHEDEFLILVESFRDPAEIAELARQLVEIVEKSHVMAGLTISLGINLGVAFYPEHGRKKSTLLRHADIALSEAVKNHVGFQLFTPELKDRMVENVELQNGMLLALESQANPDEKPQFELYLHPQVEVRQWGTPQVQGRIVGAEALLRWKHPTRGFIPPVKFIPVAEETGLIIPLGQWILHSAIGYIIDLRKQGFKHVSVSVNFSSTQFNYEDVAFMVKDIVRRRGIEPSSLKLEITESGLMDNVQDTIHKATTLREAGFKILVDDFGTGYSSLSYLKDLPVDVVKIDKSFIDGIPDSPSDQALTRAIVALARDLNLGVIVEGTETRRQIDWLFQQGCTVFQGYYFSKPLPYADFVKLLKNFPKAFLELANNGTDAK